MTEMTNSINIDENFVMFYFKRKVFLLLGNIDKTLELDKKD